MPDLSESFAEAVSKAGPFFLAFPFGARRVICSPPGVRPLKRDRVLFFTKQKLGGTADIFRPDISCSGRFFYFPNHIFYIQKGHYYDRKNH